MFNSRELEFLCQSPRQSRGKSRENDRKRDYVALISNCKGSRNWYPEFPVVELWLVKTAVIFLKLGALYGMK